ncbi:hypothetical protein SDC9_180791 [bioreactor metagenome]|uniref:Uncharacterized protein n=1 Tax=bioreactor metagenome TaxID=1076179 RepID=A0A645H490_9ZZZZ
MDKSDIILRYAALHQNTLDFLIYIHKLVGVGFPYSVHLAHFDDVFSVGSTAIAEHKLRQAVGGSIPPYFMNLIDT